jgi:hydrogenase maturation factor
VEGCVTCADAAEWMRVLEMDEIDETAFCVDARARSGTVDTGLVGTVARGDALLVHAGVAIHREPRVTAPRDTADA